jgi:hypothetical protein
MNAVRIAAVQSPAAGNRICWASRGTVRSIGVSATALELKLQRHSSTCAPLRAGLEFANDYPVEPVCNAGLKMDSKTNQIRAVWTAGDRIGALRIAARFFDRSSDTKTFKRGIAAYNNPDFYRQLGKDPQQIVGAALDVLAKRFKLH